MGAQEVSGYKILQLLLPSEGKCKKLSEDLVEDMLTIETSEG